MRHKQREKELINRKRQGDRATDSERQKEAEVGTQYFLPTVTCPFLMRLWRKVQSIQKKEYSDHQPQGSLGTGGAHLPPPMSIFGSNA